MLVLDEPDGCSSAVSVAAEEVDDLEGSSRAGRGVVSGSLMIGCECFETDVFALELEPALDLLAECLLPPTGRQAADCRARMLYLDTAPAGAMVGFFCGGACSTGFGDFDGGMKTDSVGRRLRSGGDSTTGGRGQPEDSFDLTPAVDAASRSVLTG